jgi:hypothetical protein
MHHQLSDRHREGSSSQSAANFLLNARKRTPLQSQPRYSTGHLRPELLQERDRHRLRPNCRISLLYRHSRHVKFASPSNLPQNAQICTLPRHQSSHLTGHPREELLQPLPRHRLRPNCRICHQRPRWRHGESGPVANFPRNAQRCMQHWQRFCYSTAHPLVSYRQLPDLRQYQRSDRIGLLHLRWRPSKERLPASVPAPLPA